MDLVSKVELFFFRSKIFDDRMEKTLRIGELFRFLVIRMERFWFLLDVSLRELIFFDLILWICNRDYLRRGCFRSRIELLRIY